MQPYDTVQKKNKIIFPHRISPEKQVEIFKDLAASMPEYEWFIAQEHNLSKDEYHKHIAESKVMFSANLQETLGISAYEAALVGTYPMVPKRLSYTEMWEETYPNRWVESWKAYQDNKGYLMHFIRNTMERNDLYEKSKEMAVQTGDKFFNGKELYSIIKKSMSV
jgi:isopenicillin N synthase-like dioxygenase